MSRYPIEMLLLPENKRYELVTGTDHASLELGMVPHCYAQIFDPFDFEGDGLVWSAETLTPLELREALHAQQVVPFSRVVWPYYRFGDAVPKWDPEKYPAISDHALRIFQRELDAMAPPSKAQLEGARAAMQVRRAL